MGKLLEAIVSYIFDNAIGIIVLLFAILVIAGITFCSYNEWKINTEYKLSHDMLMPEEYDCKIVCGEEMWMLIDRDDTERDLCLCYNPRG